MDVMSFLLGAMVGFFIIIVVELVGLWYFVFKD